MKALQLMGINPPKFGRGNWENVLSAFEHAVEFLWEQELDSHIQHLNGLHSTIGDASLDKDVQFTFALDGQYVRCFFKKIIFYLFI